MVGSNKLSAKDPIGRQLTEKSWRRKSMKKTALVTAAILTLTLPPIAFAAENAPGVTATEIKIGATYPFSGPASAYAATGKGVIAYIDYLNDKAGSMGARSTLSRWMMPTVRRRPSNRPAG
jgi:ABC-type branched-subunit amino acid transport system substrate-binding protein